MIYYNEHTYHSQINWRVKSNAVYRLLDNKQWLDNFFEKGELLLSCFSKFRLYPNEIQGDRREGDGFCYFVDDNGTTQAFKYEGGMNSLVLSTSEKITEKIITDFQAVGAIKILNTTRFALEVSKRISYCYGGLEGRCNYSDSRVFTINDNKKIAELFRAKNFKPDQEFAYELQSLTKEYELFQKSKNYEDQNEYRLIWFTKEPVSSSLNINCPEALEYCDRIDF